MERSAKLPSNVLRLLKRPRHLGHAESQSNIQGKCRRCKFSSQPQVSNPGSNKMAGGRVCSSRCEILRFKDVKIPSFFFLPNELEGEKKIAQLKSVGFLECQPRHGICAKNYLDFSRCGSKKRLGVFHLQSMPVFRSSFNFDITCRVLFTCVAEKNQKEASHTCHKLRSPASTEYITCEYESMNP